MKRRLGAMTALLCLCGTSAALAAGPVNSPPNSYTGSFAVLGAAGSNSRPAAAALTESLGMKNVNPSDVGAPLVDIKTTIYGVKAPNAKYFPTCTAAKINSNGSSGKWNAACPSRSLVAKGTVTAALVSHASNLAGPGAPCDLGLWVYNAGPGKLTFFLTTTPAQCDGLATGAAAAWTGKVSQAGKYLVTNVPEPPDASYNAGNLNSLFGSLQTEILHFKKMTVRRGGKTYAYIESTGCSRHARPYTIRYTATQSLTGSPTEGIATVKGSAKCR